MVIVLTSNGKLRIGIYPMDLNKAIRREHFPLKTIEDVIQQINQFEVFSKLDATNGRKFKTLHVSHSIWTL